VLASSVHSMSLVSRVVTCFGAIAIGLLTVVGLLELRLGGDIRHVEGCESVMSMM
jgi:hypothetical protein